MIVITKKVLTNKTYACDFLKNTLPPKIVSQLDFSRLKIEKGDFIDSENKERFTDLLYSVPTKKQGAASLGIFCLVEHKSYKDKAACYMKGYPPRTVGGGRISDKVYTRFSI